MSSPPPSEAPANRGESIAQRKRAARAQASAGRDARDASDRSLDALAIARHVLAFLPEGGGAVAAYLPIRSEVDTALLIALLRQSGRPVAVPAIEGESLRFRLIEDASDLEPQGFGTLAPGPDAPAVEPSVILAPLLAFDAAGNRLGYGRGFYDRAIAEARARGAVQVVGLAFSSQEMAAVPADEHDERLDAIVTENGARVPSAAASRSR